MPPARPRIGLLAALAAAAVAGPLVAIGISTAGAAGQTVTTLGGPLMAATTPNSNICGQGASCTYLPNPALIVPFDGTVTSFSLNSDSAPASGAVHLRVLRPAGGISLTGAGTGPAETITSTGISTFQVSVPVKKGDLIALNDDSSALLFDTSDTTATTNYYMPGLAHGQTGPPNQTAPMKRLLMSAVVESSTGTTTTTGTTSTTSTTSTKTTTTTTTTTTTSGKHTVVPALSHVGESHSTWRESRRHGPSGQPVGTSFSFTLNESARVIFTFQQQLTGRKVKGHCVAQTSANRSRRACKLVVTRASLTLSGHRGTNKLSFHGRLSRTKALIPGRYTLLISASNGARQRSNVAHLSFSISA
jgi:hypothetical protein